jgi:hypothetical protein
MKYLVQKKRRTDSFVVQRFSVDSLQELLYRQMARILYGIGIKMICDATLLEGPKINDSVIQRMRTSLQLCSFHACSKLIPCKLQVINLSVSGNACVEQFEQLH